MGKFVEISCNLINFCIFWGMFSVFGKKNVCSVCCVHVSTCTPTQELTVVFNSMHPYLFLHLQKLILS